MLTWSEEQVRSAAEVFELEAGYLKGRMQVNARRVGIIHEMLARRGVAADRCDLLEVGSHLGLGLLAWRSQGRRVGLELYQKNVDRSNAIGQLLGEKAEFVQGSAERLPFESASFDVVQSHHVIEHMDPAIWPAYLSEMARVLRPGGYSIVSFPHYDHPIEVHYRIPFLHWLPPRMRPAVSRLSLRRSHVKQSSRTYEVTDGAASQVSFTEFPKASEVRRLASAAFKEVEDVTREFLDSPAMREKLGGAHGLALLLADTWVCPERKLLLRA